MIHEIPIFIGIFFGAAAAARGVVGFGRLRHFVKWQSILRPPDQFIIFSARYMADQCCSPISVAHGASDRGGILLSRLEGQTSWL
jgi:hypothetical protein